MRKFAFASLYTALAVLANAAHADPATLRSLKDGDMRKLTVHSQPQEVGASGFETEAGGEGSLADYEGKVVLVNFWATWCAPCRKEMPHLGALQEALGGEDFEVVTIASGRNPQPAVESFFEETGVSGVLPMHRDPTQELAREMGVLGLPVTVLIDREGREVARLQGDADWSSESAMAIISELVSESGTQDAGEG